MKFSTVNFLVVFCLKLSASVATVTGDDLEVYNESIFDEIMPAATFQCAVDNQLEQDAATTPSVPSCYWYAQAHHGKAPDKKRRPLLENWEPLLEPVGGTHESCSGLPQEANVADKPLVQFSFLCVLDREWINYYDVNQVHFATQGYFTLLDSVNLMWDRVSVLFEAQFGIRVNCARVVAVPLLTHVCATNNNRAEGPYGTEAHTYTQLTALDIPLRTTSEAGTIRFGTGSPVKIGNWGGYCHSSSPVSSLCSSSLVQMHTRPFNDDAPGFLNYQAVRTLAHELGHFMGICRSDQADCLNSHTANEVGDIMVWDGGPIQDYRSMGMFYKFATKCTPMYSDLLCSSVRAHMYTSPTCAVPLTCTNGGLAECGTKHVLARTESNANLGVFYTETVDRDEKHYVRCCSLSGSVKTTDLGGLDCVQRSEQGFLPDKGCSGLMNYPDAVSFCKQGHLHLCSSEELFDNWETDKSAVGGVDGTCGYHIDHWVWTRDTPITTNVPSILPSMIPSSNPSTVPSNKPPSCSDYNRRKCGKKKQCVWNNGKRVIERCLVKKPRWEDDCTKYTKDRKCKKKFCKWDDGVCLHKCDTKDKMKCKEEVFTGKANVTLCKYKREPNLDFKTCLDKPTEG